MSKKVRNKQRVCLSCSKYFFAADVKANLCPDCSTTVQVFCSCGCGTLINRTIAEIKKGSNYKLGHGTRGKKYLEIYGTSTPNCGAKQGELNVAKNPEVREKISAALKEGAHWIFTHPEVGIRMKSKIEDVVALYVRNWERHKRIGRYTVDFMLPSEKKVLEVYGCYWHACPLCAETIHISDKQRKLVTSYDLKRNSYIESQGWSIEILWEHDISRWIEGKVFNQSMKTVRRYHDISCGHRVVGHEGHCANLHGHNYRITFVCASAALDEIGRVIDFGSIKELLCEWLEENWDHRFLIWTEDPIREKLKKIDPTVVSVPFNPTAENIAWYLAEVVGPKMLKGTGVHLVQCSVEETRKCSAEHSIGWSVTYKTPEYELIGK